MLLTSKLTASRPFFLIAGLNVLESYAHTRLVASELQRITRALGIELVFKASFDKANRTALEAFRGPGIVEGLHDLQRLKQDLGPSLAVVTDVHEAWQCEAVQKAGLDMIQIPAFLCRQTDLLLAAGRTGLPVLIKKAQFASPQVMHFAAAKIQSCAEQQQNKQPVLLCERGTSVGSDSLVVDFRNLVLLRHSGVAAAAATVDPLVVFDATHSGQHPPGALGRSDGDAFAVRALARAAVAVGVHGLFLEVHEAPARAPVDSKLQFPLDQTQDLLRELVDIANASKWRRDTVL